VLVTGIAVTLPGDIKLFLSSVLGNDEKKRFALIKQGEL